MFPPSSRNFEDTDVWFSVNDSKSQGAGVSAIYLYPSPISLNLLQTRGCPFKFERWKDITPEICEANFNIVIFVLLFFLLKLSNKVSRWSCTVSFVLLFVVRRPTRRLLNSFYACFSFSLAVFQCVVGQINYYISFVITLIRFMDKPEVIFQNQGKCTLMPDNTERMPLEFFNYLL